MADVSELQVSAEEAARQARRLGLWARVVLVPVAAIGAVLSFRSLYQAAVPTFGDYLATGFPLLVDLLILGASLQYVAGAKIGRPMAGWRLTAHAGVAGTLVLNALAAKELGEVPWHVTAPAVWAVLVELTAKQVLGEWKATHVAKADSISLPLWMTAPVESVRTRLLMFRTGINNAHQARIAVGVNAAAREALRLALPRRNARRVRRIINRQLRAGSLTPVAILRPLGWTRGGVILSNARPDVILQAVLQEVLDPGAPPVAVEPVAPPVPRSRLLRRPQPGARPSVDQPGHGQVGHGQPVYGWPEPGEQGHDQPGYGQPVYDQAGHGQPVYEQAVYGQPVYGQPESGQPGSGPPARGSGPEPVIEPAAQHPAPVQHPAAAQQPIMEPPPGVTQPAALRPGTVQQPARALQLGRALHRGRVLQQQTGTPDGAASAAEQLRMELARTQVPQHEPAQAPTAQFGPVQFESPQGESPHVEVARVEAGQDLFEPVNSQPSREAGQPVWAQPHRGFGTFRPPSAGLDPNTPGSTATGSTAGPIAGPIAGRPGSGRLDEVEILDDVEHLGDLDGQEYPDAVDGLVRDDYIDEPSRPARSYRSAVGSDTTVTLPR